ncbi:Uncharacterized protein K02A2.6 [Vitis vinifera]|uniref:Uncharacterized protein K02A2.6 n=1 Tax=Vitis vinifera TaxID=29760 RepID=A0A438J087_VITVI|nr:Uncharacterized protein K02A2.6 [Vitis vinifera]
MTTEETQSMQNILRRNHVIFAWAHSDMKGIHPSIASHRLNVFLTAKPVRQKIRCFHPDRQKVIRNEIDKLMEAGFIREVAYPDWLANVVVVRQKEGKWWVCVDYTHLNNACPKDSFPLPRIDQIGGIPTVGPRNALFLGCLLRISPDSQCLRLTRKNSIHNAIYDLYCYKVMPFGLKNAGATYQRLMTKIFKPLIGHTVEVYIDDIVVKSKTREEHVLHLQEVFHLLRKYDMNLNPSKCAFGVSVGKFSGFHGQPKRDRGEPGPSQGGHGNTSPQEQKGITAPHRQLVALGRFIARFTDELRPFFLAIRKQSALFYSVVLTQGAETNLLRQQSIGGRRNQVFKNGANSLSPSERCLEALPYFQAHPVVVLTDQPPPQHSAQARFKPVECWQWAIKLSKFGIDSQPKLSMKGQVMADFVLEYSRRPNQHQESNEKNGGLCELMELHDHQGPESGFCYNPNRLPHSLSKKPFYCLYMCKPTPLIVGISTCNTIKANQTNDQDWTDNIAEYLRTGTLPGDPKQAHKIRVQAARGRSLAHRAHSQGYYWPTMKKDAAAYVKKCDKCQRYAPIPHMPSATLKSISGPWPFAQWGMDIVGPLPTALPRRSSSLSPQITSVNGWKAEAYAGIKDKDVTKFVWKKIVCRFGIPQTIIADNGPQFDSIAFRNFCLELNIRNSYSTPPRYPQSNGQAEATNKTLITALKKRLEQAKGKWVEELPGVLWAY